MFRLQQTGCGGRGKSRFYHQPDRQNRMAIEREEAMIGTFWRFRCSMPANKISAQDNNK